MNAAGGAAGGAAPPAALLFPLLGKSPESHHGPPPYSGRIQSAQVSGRVSSPQPTDLGGRGQALLLDRAC